MPTHTGTLGDTLQNIRDTYQEFHEGDVILHNDPYSGGAHQGDVAVVRPMFVQGELQGFAMNRGHWTDVGGMTPGGWSGTARDVVQEALLIPPVKLYRGGVLNREIKDLVLRNVRMAKQCWAAVILEPVGGAWLAGVAAEVPFLEAIRRVTEEEGIILIYDEVITGFRLSLSGAVSISGVVPDLRALGKAIGGGLPIGVYGGKREIMDTVVTPASQPHEKDKMYQSGTFTGNPMSTAAGLAMISGLEKPGVYERMNGHGERIRTTLMKMGDELGIELQAVGEGSIFGVFFAGHPIRNIRDVARSNAERGRAFFMGLVANGLYVTPFHLGFTNAAQTDEDIDRVLDIFGHVLEEIKAYG